jgi:nucleotide-binding universal stress UspA family protein
MQAAAARSTMANVPASTILTPTMSADPAGTAAPFGRILCAIDGGGCDREAIRQALILAGRESLVTFAALVSLDAASRFGAEGALDDALRTARHAGIRASGKLLIEADPVAALTEEEARLHELLVVGSHGSAGGEGSSPALPATRAAVAALREAWTPVLVARKGGDRFPRGRILLASDGSPAARRAVRLTGALAARHRAPITLMTVRGATWGDLSRELAREAEELTAATGRAPDLVTATGVVHEAIVQEAADARIALTVMGSRGLAGLRALGSVSARVAERASCSVLVVRER